MEKLETMVAEVIDYTQYLPDVFMMKIVQCESRRVHIFLIKIFFFCS